jgi:hypothetical protein
MKDAVNAGARGHHRWFVLDVALDDFNRRVACVLIEVCPPANHEIV